MKWVLNILGGLLIITGSVWILQGIGVYPVGFMAHDLRYAYAGVIVDLIAITLFIIANRKHSKIPPVL